MDSTLARSVTAALLCALLPFATAQKAAPSSVPVYRQSHAPIERRIDDLIRRMTLAEKVRQLDLYSGAKDLVDAHTDNTHAAPDAAFVPERAETLLGTLGVGGI